MILNARHRAIPEDRKKSARELVRPSVSEARRAIKTDAAPAAIGPYSQAVRAGPWLFISGQIPLTPGSAELVPGGVTDQTARVLENLEAILKAAGLDFSSVVKTTVYLRDLSKFQEMNETYARYFKSHPPARSTVEVSGLPKGALVEIEAVACGPVEALPSPIRPSGRPRRTVSRIKPRQGRPDR